VAGQTKRLGGKASGVSKAASLGGTVSGESYTFVGVADGAAFVGVAEGAALVMLVVLFFFPLFFFPFLSDLPCLSKTICPGEGGTKSSPSTEYWTSE
jgi:hypothetical protein